MSDTIFCFGREGKKGNEFARGFLLFKPSGTFINPEIIERAWLEIREKLSYWPWIKNYYDEITAGNYSDIMPMVTQMWIDTTLKAKQKF